MHNPRLISATPRRAMVLPGLAAMAAVLALGGCGKKPGGQVLAVVNNQEITGQEIRTEAVAENLPATTDFKAATPALLDRVIQRTLMADFAHKQGLDKGPEFVARRRQLEQTLLASLALNKIVGKQTPPTPAEVQAYMAKNQTQFAQRQRLQLDQIRFPTPARREDVQALTKLPSMDAIAAKLKADGIAAVRQDSNLDTGSISTEIAKQIVVLPNGELFDLSIAGQTFISAIKARQPITPPAGGWAPIATEAFARERVASMVGAKVEELRKTAKIQYDPAYKPKPVPAAPAAAK